MKKKKLSEKNTDVTQMVSIDVSQKNMHPAILTVIMGPHQWIGRFWSISGDHVFGRDSSQTSIYIPNNTLSRRHLELKYVSADEVKVADLGSTNGSFLNDEPLKANQFYNLKDNDILRVGDIVFKYIAAGNMEAHSIFKFRDEVYTDPLCQIYNRKYMEDKGQELISKCQKNNSPLSFIIFDLDHFKKVNDQYSHLAGDFILSCVSSLVQKCIRKSDAFCRIGGEEFSIVLECPLTEATQLMEQVRQKIENETFDFEGQPIQITISSGVTSLESSDKSWKDLYERADSLLYKAKKQGRNQICS